MTNRAAVLAAIEAANDWLTGHEVALMTGLQYKQTIDALYALYNDAHIARKGRKFTARWGSIAIQAQESPPSHAILFQALHRMCTK